MIINAHSHVFTFKTFLTEEAEANLAGRLRRSGLSEPLANDLLAFAREALLDDVPDDLASRLYAFFEKLGGDKLPLFTFFDRGCLQKIGDVTEALLADAAAGAAGLPGERIVVPLMMDVIAENSSDVDRARYDAQYEQTVLEAVRHPGRVLPFVAVNPRRGPKAYERMMQALESGECVGVKLYPSLGYEGAGDMYAMLEKVLIACQEFSAPLTMHCNDGGFCGHEEYDYTYCSPVNWRERVETYDVRFNFAHFGDQTPGKWPKGKAPLWREVILELMDTCPERVFADVSFQSGPLGKPAERKTYVAWLKGELASRHGGQILWGTDSFMLFLSAFEREYWQFFRGALGPDFQRIAGDNPRRFLGLPAKGEAVEEETAMGRHIAFLKKKKNEAGSRFREGSAPAAWLDGRL